MTFHLNCGRSRIIDRILTTDIHLCVQMTIRSHHKTRIFSSILRPGTLLQIVTHTAERHSLKLRTYVAGVGNDQQVIPTTRKPHKYRFSTIVTLHGVTIQIHNFIYRGRGRRIHTVCPLIKEQHQIVDARLVVLSRLIAVTILATGGG